jgi:putative ABC transport system permease protein
VVGLHWGASTMKGVLQDIKFSFRASVKNPLFSLVIILVLALGIAASTALFSVVYGVLINPVVYVRPDRAVVLSQTLAKRDRRQFFFSPPEYFDIRDRTQIFQNLAAISDSSAEIASDYNPERVSVGRVTANAFSMTGIGPALGRTFLPAEDRPGGDAVVVLSDRLWQRRYTGDKSIVGRSLTLDRTPYTIIGVMPPRWSMWGCDLWIPLALNTADESRAARTLWLMGWLKPGISEQAANNQLASFSQSIAEEYGHVYPEYAGFKISPGEYLYELTRGIKPSLYMLLAAVGLLLLITCANLSNMLSVRIAAREKEIAIRRAMGAGTARIIRQLVIEGVFFSFIGGVLGFMLATWSVALLVSYIPPGYIASSAEIHVSYSAFAFAMGLSVLMGIVISTYPALTSSGRHSFDVLKEAGRGTIGSIKSRRFSSALVALEIALAVIVMSGSGVMIRTYMKLSDIDAGFATRRALTMRVLLPQSRYPSGDQVATFFKNLIDKVERIPGVEQCAISSARPMAEVGRQDFFIEGQPIEETGAVADFSVVSPGYLDVMRIPLISGRFFNEADRQGAPLVAVINQTMARTYFPNIDAIGARIRLGQAYAQADTGSLGGPGSDAPLATIVGVAGDTKQSSDFVTPIRPGFYLAHAQRAERARNMALIVRSSMDPAALTQAVQREVQNLDSQQPVYDIMTMEQIIDNGYGVRRISMILLTLFALLSLVLVTVGVYSLLGHSVSQRMGEIGIRMALGADRSQVLWLVLKQGLMLAILGLAIGSLVSIGVTRTIGSLLYEISPNDPLTMALIPVPLILVTVLAAWIPARRAALVDPLIALRHE